MPLGLQAELRGLGGGRYLDAAKLASEKVMLL